MGFVLASLMLVPTLGQNFFPPVETIQLKLHVRGPTGLRIEETGRLFTRVEDAIRQIAGPGAISSIVDNIGLPISGINMAYGNSGTIGSADGDILITLKEGQEKQSDELVRVLREKLPQLFPDATFSFLPADIVTQILNFGLPAPIDVQIVGNNREGNRELANKLLKRIAGVPASPTPASSSLAISRRSRWMSIAFSPTASASLNKTSPSPCSPPWPARSRPIRCSGSIRRMACPIRSWFRRRNIGCTRCWTWPASRFPWAARRRCSAPSPISGGPSPTRWSLIIPSSRCSTSTRPTADAISAASPADISKIIDEFQSQRPRGTQIILRGQTATMNSAYTQLYAGLAWAIVLIYLLIVVNFQSWTDPFVIVSALPAALAGVTWMLFATHTTLSVPALTGAIMTMGVATANSILVVSFAREQLSEGLEPFAAALNAGVGRFRPVLMTALAMIIGMAPMALSAEQNAPLGRAVIGGLIFATVATLIFVPVVFGLVHSWGENGQTDETGETAVPENAH